MENFEIWSNTKQWKSNWIEAKENYHPSKGGQGEVRLVHRKNSDNRIYFLKFLGKNNTNQSRERMYTEVSLYETISISGVPKLIESNCRQYHDKDYELYLVTEHIEGINLIQALNTIDAINCIKKLCNIIAHIHGKPTPIIHRDIKPSNIILHNNNWNDPWLVDFGLSNELGISQEKISINQEIGNRFLRLPEFVKDSPLKRDLRSDVTLCAGILFYLLTGEEPRILVDANGLMPHQRLKMNEKLEKHSNHLDIHALLLLFDQSFKQHIDQRFQSIEELIARINDLDISHKIKTDENTEFKSQSILKRINTFDRKEKLNIMANLNNVSNFIKNINDEITREFNNSFRLWSSEKPYPIELKYDLHLTFEDKLNPSTRFEIIYIISHVGNEIVINANEKNIDRFNVDQFEDHSLILKDKTREYVINGLFSILE